MTGKRPDPELLAALFACLDTGVYAVDGHGRVIACNPSAERLLGHGAGALLGRDADEALDPGPGGPRGLPDRLAPGTGEQRTGGDRGALRRADGTPLAVWWTASPLPLGPGRAPGAVVVFHDASEEWARDARREHRFARSETVRKQAQDDLAEVRWLSELTLALVTGLETGEGPARVTRLLVRRLADAAVLDLAESPGRVHRAAWAHRTPGAVPPGAVPDPPPTHAEDSTAALARVLSGASTRHLTAATAAPPGERDPLVLATADLLTALDAREALIVPLRLRDVTLGAFTLTRGPGSPPFSDADRLLAEEVARRTALGLDNARLHTQQAGIAATLQRALLTDLPAVTGLELAAHYQPAGHAAEVGGDWYDAFELPGGDLAVVVGDVTGHDIRAAARMGELRNMLRALAVDRPGEDPGAVLRRLDIAQAQLGLADTATAVLARLHPRDDGTWHLTWSAAGHPPPLLLGPGGRARYLTEGHAMLIGVRPGTPRPVASLPLPPGSTVLLYTDGLVESRLQDLDTGMHRLRRHAAARDAEPLGRLCAALAGALGDTRDDITLIAVRVPPPAPAGHVTA
ncbi:SpoIIE family protein phosphatase [Streptomyces capparidis]